MSVPTTTKAPTISDLVTALEEARPHILPQWDEAAQVDDQHGLAVARFSYELAVVDPRMEEAATALDLLLDEADHRLEARGRLNSSIHGYITEAIQANATLVVELERWVSEELARPGGAEMLDALWSRLTLDDLIPEAIRQMIFERAGVSARS